MPCVGATSRSYLIKPSFVDVCFRMLGVFLAKNKQNSLLTGWVFAKLCSESQKLGFFRLQNHFPTLLRNLWRMGHLHNGSICCQDFGSFAKILTTHETAKFCLYTLRMTGLPFFWIQCTFDICQSSIFWFRYTYYIKTQFCWNRFLLESNALMIFFGYMLQCTTLNPGNFVETSWIWSCGWSSSIKLLVPAVFQHIPRNLIGILWSIQRWNNQLLECSPCRRVPVSLPKQKASDALKTASLMKQRPAVSTDIPEASVICVHTSHKLSGCETSSASHFSHSLQNCSTLDLRDWAVATRLLNLNSFFFNFSFSSWSCCNCNVTACLLHSFFKRSDSCSSCLFLFLNLSHSDWISCICNACSCLLDSSSFTRSDSISSCLFLKVSHSSWSCCICNVSACLWDSSCFKPSHSCVSCWTWMWSSSCFVFKLASEVIVVWCQQKKKLTLKKSQGLLSSFQRWIQIFIIWGSKSKMPIELKPLLANTCRSPSGPSVPVGSSKSSHERPWPGTSADPWIQGSATTTAASTPATGRPETNPIFLLPSSRPARHDRWPPEGCGEPPSNAPGWRPPDPSVVFSRCWIRPKSRAGPARAPGRNRDASGISTLCPKDLRFSAPTPPAPRSQDPRVCPGGPSVLELWLTFFSSTSDALVGLWGDNLKTFVQVGATPSFWIKRKSLPAPNSLHSILLSHHGRKCIQYMQMALANEIHCSWPVVGDGRRQSTQLLSGQVSLWIDLTCDQNRSSKSFSAYCLTNMLFRMQSTDQRTGHIVKSEQHITQWRSSSLRAASFYVAGCKHFPINSFSSWYFLMYFCGRLRVSFSPCDQTFQIPQHIGHPVDVLHLLSRYPPVVFSHHCM